MHETRWFYDDDYVKWTSYIKEPETPGERPYLRFDSERGSRWGGDTPEVLAAWRECSALELQLMCEEATGID